MNKLLCGYYSRAHSLTPTSEPSVGMASFTYTGGDRGKSQQTLRHATPQDKDSRRLMRHVDHSEREKSAILHNMEKQQHLYRKSLEQLQGRNKPASSSPLLKLAAASGSPSFPNSRPSGSDLAPPDGRGFGQLRSRGTSVAQANSPAPLNFSRYVPNDKLLGGSNTPHLRTRSTNVLPNLSNSRTPDVNALRRREATPTHSPQRQRIAAFLSPGDPLKRSVSDRSVYLSSLTSDQEAIDVKPPEAKQEVLPKSPGNKRRDASNKSSSEVTALLDMLPSINSASNVTGNGKADETKDDETDGTAEELPENYGMSTRLVKAVHEIETRLADHNIKMEDRKSTEAAVPINVLLPDKTRKYQTYMTLPPSIPIPWHLYGEEYNDDDDEGVEEGEVKKRARKRSSSLETASVGEKSELAQQFEEMKNCRYLRKYKPNMKRESWF